MKEPENKLDKLRFLLGEWDLEYRIPESSMHVAGIASATGVFQRALNNNAVIFDYSGVDPSGDQFGAHGIFLWDEKAQIIRFWWFEYSGAFMTAACEFIDNDTLFMSWHNSLLTQTFTRIDPSRVILHMGRPAAQGKHELLLEVIFTRK